MAHISGLVAAKVIPSPFDHADVVTTTTHKSLRGPRGAMIFFRKGVKSIDKNGKETMYDIEGPINFSVFPGLQGGPHNHTISALATALKQVNQPAFVAYQEQVLKNAKTLVHTLMECGYEIVSGGTDNHLALINMKGSKGIDGARVEYVLEKAGIVTNKNTIPGDKSAVTPGGIRIGTLALTSRGLNDEDFVKVARFIDRGVQIAATFQQLSTGRKLRDFKKFVDESDEATLQELRSEVENFATQFPLIGYE